MKRSSPVPQASDLRRVADADRDKTVTQLSVALADGRIDQTEFADRAEAALVARFRVDLDPLVADLHTEEEADEGTDGRSETVKISVFALISAVVSFGAGLVVGDPLTGVLLWLVSLVCVGVGVLIGRGRTSSRPARSKH